MYEQEQSADEVTVARLLAVVKGKPQALQYNEKRELIMLDLSDLEQ